MTFERWFLAFVFTQLVEVPIYARALSCSLLVAFGASAITHPIVWAGFFNPAFEASYEARVIAAETFAWLAEAAWFGWAFKKGRRALLWSFVANAASVIAGQASRALFGAP